MKLEGYIEHVIYHSENGYTVFVLINNGQEITCVGSFSSINEGEYLELEGAYQVHPTYGDQFRVEKFTSIAPKDVLAMERYLGSGAVKGIGAALAARIVRRFQGDTFRIIEEEPERLAEIKGISEKRAREIAAQLEEKREMRQAMLFLQQYGISPGLSVKIFQKYGQAMYDKIKKNPYQLADDIEGVGFRTADEIAQRVGICQDSDFRVRSGILYTLLQAAGEGHTCLPKDRLLFQARELLQVPEEVVEKHLTDLYVERRLVQRMLPNPEYTGFPENGDREAPFFYAESYYHMELRVASMLCALNQTLETEGWVQKRLEQVERRSKIRLEEEQRQAVVEAVQNGLLIITGGPGTGKTTTINTIIQYFEEENLEILLAAPTGRAAKRMTETTGYEAKTIHRLLELTGNPEQEQNRAVFMRDGDNPLEADVVIIDEMSMVDLFLMQALLRAILPGTRLILVGDVNQLPSVGPGNVLRDMIASEAFPVVRLTRIFRQAAESDIIVNAHRINRGEPIKWNNKSRDFFFLERQEPLVVARVVLALVQEKLPRYVKAKPFDIQVLTPMRKGPLGVEQLNGILQEYLNPKDSQKEEKEYKKGLFREGDKVMQIRNNYQLEWEVRNRYGMAVDRGLGIFNGDMGIIKQINHFAENMQVEFDEGRLVTYDFKQLDELELAYAITIHKSQGSEYPAVVIPLLGGPRMLMNRNLLYTAVTRARACVTLVGSAAVFENMVKNESEQKRYSGLSQTIRSYLSAQMPHLS